MLNLTNANVAAIVEALTGIIGTGNVSAKSPFRKERRPSFSINTTTGAWKDHGTGESGGILDLYAKVERKENAPKVELISDFIRDFDHLGVRGDVAPTRTRLKRHYTPPQAKPRPQAPKRPTAPVPFDVSTISTTGESALLRALRALAEQVHDGGETAQRLRERAESLDCVRVDKTGAQVWPVRRDGVTVSAKVMEYNGVRRGGRLYYAPKGAQAGIFGDRPTPGRVAVAVEAEKSALVAGLWWPGFDWVAVGGAEGLTQERAEQLRGARVVVVVFDLDEPGEAAQAAAIERLREWGVPVDVKASAKLREELRAIAAALWEPGTEPKGVDVADVVLLIWETRADRRLRRLADVLSVGVSLCMGDGDKTPQEAGKVASLALWGDNGEKIAAKLYACGMVAPAQARYVPEEEHQETTGEILRLFGCGGKYQHLPTISAGLSELGRWSYAN